MADAATTASSGKVVIRNIGLLLSGDIEPPGAIRNAFTPAACSVAGKLYVSPPDGKVYRLTIKKDAWEEVGNLETSRMVHRMVPAADDLLLVVYRNYQRKHIPATKTTVNMDTPSEI